MNRLRSLDSATLSLAQVFQECSEEAIQELDRVICRYEDRLEPKPIQTFFGQLADQDRNTDTRLSEVSREIAASQFLLLDSQFLAFTRDVLVSSMLSLVEQVQQQPETLSAEDADPEDVDPSPEPFASTDEDLAGLRVPASESVAAK